MKWFNSWTALATALAFGLAAPVAIAQDWWEDDDAFNDEYYGGGYYDDNNYGDDWFFDYYGDENQYAGGYDADESLADRRDRGDRGDRGNREDGFGTQAGEDFDQGYGEYAYDYDTDLSEWDTDEQQWGDYAYDYGDYYDWNDSDSAGGWDDYGDEGWFDV